MFLYYSSLLSYCPSTDPNDYALLRDVSWSKMSGHGTAIFTMNGRSVLVCNKLHIPSIRASLYSPQRHRTQPVCAYYDGDTAGNLLLFPTMVIDVDSATNNIVSFWPIVAFLGVKRDCNYNPQRAKSRIVVLGNHKDCAFNKSHRFAPVLSYSSLWILNSKAINKRHIHQKGDCKNAFYNALLPDDEIAIVRRPLGDPDSSPNNFSLLNKTLYGLRRSPQHCYNLIKKILKQGPAQDLYCFYTPSNLSELQSCKSIISTNFPFIFIFKYCTTQLSH